MKSAGKTRIFFVLLAATVALMQSAALSSLVPTDARAQEAAHFQQKARTKEEVEAQAQAVARLAVRQGSLTLTLTPAPTAPTTNQNVHFKATSSQPGLYADNYYFDWGDGQNSTTNQPESDHSYAAPGTYTVTVKTKGVFNDHVIEVPGTTAITVSQPQESPLPRPTLRLDDPVHPQEGNPVTLIAEIDASAGSPEYHFYFGDGEDEQSQTNQVVHIYKNGGTYHPYVSATLDGRKPVNSKPIDLLITKSDSGKSISKNPKPRKLTVTALTTNPTAGNSVIVQASLSPPADAVYEFAWDNDSGFEKGGESGIASHKYLLPGNHTVRVRASVKGWNTSPIIGSTPITVAWSPLLVVALVVLTMLAAAVVLRIRTPKGHPNAPVGMPTQLNVVAHLAAGSHRIFPAEQEGFHVSLTLNPGMDPGEHRITFL